MSIKDLLNDEGNFFSHQDFINKYNLNCNFLQYFQVFAPIPKHLRDKAKKTSFDHNKFKDNDFCLAPNISIDLLKVKNKNSYSLFLNKLTIKPTGARKWKEETNSRS